MLNTFEKPQRRKCQNCMGWQLFNKEEERGSFREITLLYIGKMGREGIGFRTVWKTWRDGGEDAEEIVE